MRVAEEEPYLAPRIFESTISRYLALAFLLISAGWPNSVNCASFGSGMICGGDYRLADRGSIDCKTQRKIVDSHNRIRQHVALERLKNHPGSSNMQQMYWDDDLARTAQEWADRCTYKHDDPFDDRFDVGQNLALQTNTGRNVPIHRDFEHAIREWYLEHENYTFGPMIPGEMIRLVGHYTQLVWAESNLVGCGFTRYVDDQKKYSYRFYVCNYGPTGNYEYDVPYEAGVGQNCPAQTKSSARFEGLCAAKIPPTSECTRQKPPGTKLEEKPRLYEKYFEFGRKYQGDRIAAVRSSSASYGGPAEAAKHPISRCRRCRCRCR